MPTAVDQFLGNLQRRLSRCVEFRVVAVNQPYVGQKLDNCLVLERVGSGAMSVVYKAQQDFTDRIVAIKMLRAQLCCDNSNVKRFQREAKAISRLSHQNLLNIYGVGRTPSGQPYIIMDYVQGKSLAELLAENGAIPWQRVATIFLQVCDAMQHAHAHRIIHRDLKPDNIMLVKNPTGNDQVKVVDFGIVKITDESQALSQRLTQTGEVWGSPVYMSPEQCMGKDLDARSDIYSLGTVLYECLTGKQIFSGKIITEIVMKQLNQQPESFATARGDSQVPAWLEQVTMRALEKDPAKRFGTMEEMKRHIERGLLSNKDTADSVLKPPMASDAHISAVRMPANGDEFIGKTIGGKFLVESLIGDGGMSVVYKAIQQGINRPVAIKLLRDELCDEEANVKRFMREARAVSQLSHPNLVAIYDVGTAFTGQPYMVMEYLQGQSLSELLEDCGRLSLERALPIFIQTCDVMQYAHSLGFIHRDLKPHNIMLITAGDRKDFVKLVDFGIVAFDGNMQAASQKLTAAGEICGSPIYMSPEQVLDEPVDARSDIYSFGVVMYECLAGRPVFGGKKITDVLSKHVNTSPPPFCESAPSLDIPPALEGVIFKTLEKRPASRFQTMAELKEALTTIGKRSGYISSVSLGPTASAARMLAAQGSASELTTTTASGVRPAISREDAAKSEKSGTAAGGKSKTLVIALIAMVVGAAIAGAAVLYMFNEHKRQDEDQRRDQQRYEQLNKDPQPSASTEPQSATPRQAKPVTKAPAPVATPVKPTTRKPVVKRHSTQSTVNILNTIEDAETRGSRHNDSHSALGD